MSNPTMHFGWTQPIPGQLPFNMTVASLLGGIDTAIASVTNGGFMRTTCVMSFFPTGQVVTLGGSGFQTLVDTGTGGSGRSAQGSFLVTRADGMLRFVMTGFHLVSDGGRPAVRLAARRADGSLNSLHLFSPPSGTFWWVGPDFYGPYMLTEVGSLAPGGYYFDFQVYPPAGGYQMTNLFPPHNHHHQLFLEETAP